MKKENYGIPAGLLCISIYAMAFFSNLYVVVAALVAVFALNFESRVKKTAVQAVGITLIFSASTYFFGAITALTGVSGYATQGWKEIFDYMSVQPLEGMITILQKLISITEYTIFTIFIIAILVKKDFFIGPVYRVVDGFAPVKHPNPVNQQPMYQQPMQGQPMYQQPMQGQPMQGQPMQGQPMQGQPMQGQPMQGQPQQFNPQNPGPR